MLPRIFKSLMILPVVILAIGVFSPAPAFAKGKPPAAAKSHLSRGTDDAYFITMEPMILPVLDSQGVHEVVSVVVALEVKNQEVMEKVNRMVPKLGDAYLKALYGRLDGQSYRSGPFLDLGKLKTKLSGVTDGVVGKGTVDNVLIQGVNQRQFN